MDAGSLVRDRVMRWASGDVVEVCAQPLNLLRA